METNTMVTILDKQLTYRLASVIQKTLMHQGAILRRAQRQQLRNRKRVSRGGEAPTNQTGILKENILYAYDSSSESVVVGARQLKGSQTPKKLEGGGETTLSLWIQKRKFGVGLPGNRGGIGPVQILVGHSNRWLTPYGIGVKDPKIHSSRKGWSDTVDVIWRRLRTEKEVRNAESHYELLQFMRGVPTPPEKKTYTMEPRPFAKPALEKSRKGLMDAWRKAVLKSG